MRKPQELSQVTQLGPLFTRLLIFQGAVLDSFTWLSSGKITQVSWTQQRKQLSRKRKLMDTEFLQADRIFVETRRILLNQNRKGKIPFYCTYRLWSQACPRQGDLSRFHLSWFHHSAASLQGLFTWKWALNRFHRMEPCT